MDGEPHPELREAIRWVESRIESGEPLMWRWESCCGGVQKSVACDGIGLEQEEHRAYRWHESVTCDDTRVDACTVGVQNAHGDFETRLCVRPWVVPMRHGPRRYPVEFRAFYGPHGPLGISNYYPQAPMDPGEVDWRCFVDWVAGYARALCDAGSFPEGFSADFLVRRDGVVLFLEGGPPSIVFPHPLVPSAHPCCFAPGKISGIALAPSPGVLRE